MDEFCRKCGCEILCELNEGKRVKTETYRSFMPGRPELGRDVVEDSYVLCFDCAGDQVKAYQDWLKSSKPKKNKQSGFVKYKNAYQGCKFCAGSGCISCESQRKKAQS